VNRLPRKELARLRARIGYVFQGGALFDSMDVYENLAFPFREYAAAPEAELPQKVRELLAKVGLSGIEDKDPADLSGGMRKRVALARALALEPEVLLFDEPTTGLDPVTSDAIGKLILTTRRETGCAAVTVTHDLALARRISDRIAFLHEGKFRFVGSFEEAERSGDRELAAFLAGHSRVERVFHPSRPDHPDAATIARDYVRTGSLLAFRVKDTDEPGHGALADRLVSTGVPRYALSFDGLVTKVNHHKTVSEYFTPPESVARLGIDRLIRLGIGLEDADDLIACLDWTLQPTG